MKTIIWYGYYTTIREIQHRRDRIEKIPKEKINDKKEWIGDDKEIGQIPTFLQSYEITAHSKHYITNSEIEQWLCTSNPGTSMKKMVLN